MQRRIATVLLLGSVMTGCFTGGAQTSRSAVQQFLYVPSNAANVQWATTSVRFTLNEPFPAETFVAAIRQHFESNRWQLRDQLLPNPGHKMSDTKDGWADPYVYQGKRVFKWAANWESPKGEVIVCYVEYHTPIDVSVEREESGTVMQAHFDAATADRMKRP
jgi:hypothetical protein